MRFSNILLVVDSGNGHSLALHRAIALARNENATLTVCDVIDSIPANYRRHITSVTPPEIIATIVAEKFEQIEKLFESVDVRGLALEVKVLVGRPHVEITRQVNANQHDLVIKSITGHRTLRALSARREAKELLRSCPCPVWLVNAAGQAGTGCILAALDMPAHGATNTGLNEHILEVSRSIALAEFQQLHVVHAWHLTGEGHMRSRGTAATNLEVDRMIVREAANRMFWLRNTVNSTKSDSQRIAIDYLAPELHVIKGIPKNVVPDLAKDLGAGLVVMGTTGRSGVSGLWLGNTSEKVLSRSDCSFLVLKQPGLLSARSTAGRAVQEVRRSINGVSASSYASMLQGYREIPSPGQPGSNSAAAI